MITSLYIIASVVVYVFDVLPMHKLMEGQSEYIQSNPKDILHGKMLRRLRHIEFYAASLNLIVCFVLLVLKLAGIIKWW